MNVLKERLKPIKAIGFDLDDTLWDNREVIAQANHAQWSFLEKNCPGMQPKEIKSLYATIVEQLVQGDSIKFEDLTLLRQTALHDFCQRLNLTSSVADQCFNHFFQCRQTMVPFTSVKPSLTVLNKHFRLFVISNGNADLSHLGLSHFFDVAWQGGKDGRAKPHVELFRKAGALFHLKPEQMAYVGDHDVYDVQASSDAGLMSIQVNAKEKSDRSDIHFNHWDDFAEALLEIFQ